MSAWNPSRAFKPAMTPSPNPAPQVGERIRSIREQRVMLDFDLAELYGVPTKRFNEAFKRNRDRFPADFTFQLTPAEFAALKWSQAATSSSQPSEPKKHTPNSSQSAMNARKHRDPRSLCHSILTKNIVVISTHAHLHQN